MDLCKSPAGVESTDAELGGMMMYYAGDAIDLVIVVILCYQFFKGNSYWAKKHTCYLKR